MNVKYLTFIGNILVELHVSFGVLLPINKDRPLIKNFPKRLSDHSVVITSRYYYLLYYRYSLINNDPVWSEVRHRKL